MDRPRLPNSCFKEDTLARSPGGNRKKKAEQSNAQKGAALEKTVQSEFQKTSKAKVRRGFQGRTGGGLGNPDVSALYGWHIEVKNEKTIRLRDYIKQLGEDCPKTHKPALVLAVDETPWIMIKLADRVNFAADQIEAMGGEVVFP